MADGETDKARKELLDAINEALEGPDAQTQARIERLRKSFPKAFEFTPWEREQFTQRADAAIAQVNALAAELREARS